jgi:signal transduction histidine kinase/ActR/RegA family two-component response regulator
VTEPSSELAWRRQSPAVRLYVALVIAAGVWALVAWFPTAFPRPLLFLLLAAAACLTSIWKVNLPSLGASGSTLSVSYASDLTALLLLGTPQAILVAIAGVLSQCTFRVRRRFPLYRTLFSAAAEALTMAATGVAYARLGGTADLGDLSSLSKPLVGAITTQFVINTGLVAGAIALSTGRPWWKVWREEFWWSAASFIVAGTAGAAAAVVVARGQYWPAILMLAPVYLTYTTYRIVVGRFEDQQHHVAETRRLHQEAVEALSIAREAERALAAEKERLARALADMTRLEKTRAQLLAREHAARASAEQANRLKDQFLAIVSHELRTPLNAVLGWADMLRHDTLQGARRQRAVQAIFDGARRQSQLIEDLLDVSRIMSGTLRLARTRVDAPDVVCGALELVQPSADAKQIQVSLDIDREAGFIDADPARIQQVVWNLLTNAVKFTPEGGRIDVRLRRDGESVELTVRDTGRGIPAEFVPCVFDAFRQADASTTRTHGGLGLGLAIVKHLVEAHGGTVAAESAGEDRGATFTVRLPALPPQTAAVVAAVAPQAVIDAIAAHAPLDGVRVLIVDDDEESREVMASCLEGRSAVVETAASAAQALDVLSRTPIDVLLTDVAMPGEDGYMLLRKLRASNGSTPRSIPAIAVTAFARREDREQALRAGFQLHLAKPVDRTALVSAVARLCRATAAEASY